MGNYYAEIWNIKLSKGRWKSALETAVRCEGSSEGLHGMITSIKKDCWYMHSYLLDLIFRSEWLELTI